MNKNALVVAEGAELMWLDFVLLVFGIIDGAFARGVAPRTLYDPLLAEKVSRLNGVGLVATAEDDPIAQIQRKNLRFVVPKWWHQGGRALSGGDDCGPGLTDDVHAVVIARAITAGSHESLCLVGPQNDEIIPCPVRLRFVEPAERVVSLRLNAARTLKKLDPQAAVAAGVSQD